MGNYEYETIKSLQENNKKKMFFVFLTIFMFLGISLATIYFVYKYNDKRENKVVTALVGVDFIEKSESINLENTVPMTDERGKENPSYVFTVENISKIPVNLKIGIEIGENTIDLSAIRYALYINNEEEKVDNLENLDEGNLYIKEHFAVGAKIEVKLVFWIDYYYEKPGGKFSGTITVEGEQYDIMIYEYPTGTETIKDTLGQPGGVTGVKADNTPTTSPEEAREYRYSGNDGIKNYIYFNCSEGTTYETASTNCEKWRIVGVFKDDSGEEHLKIVRNEKLTSDMFPAEYTIGGTTYKIQYTSGDYAYWNKKTSGTNNNDWATAGLQYWLNTEEDETPEQPNKGYLSTLKGDTLSMIEETKYYLGTVTYKASQSLGGGPPYGIIDTPKEAYTYERETECPDGVGPETNTGYYLTFDETPNCRVWANNQATWTGKVALLYPSDYGFSTESSDWDSKMYYGPNGSSGQSKTSWLHRTLIPRNFEWLLSPSSNSSDDVSTWAPDGWVAASGIEYGRGVRPSLNLTSQAKIVDGDGSPESPYFVTL